VTTIAGGAGTAGDGNGGNVVISAGAKNGSGYDGVIRQNGVVFRKQGNPTALTTSATVTIAQLLTGIITGEHTAGATQTYTLPTGTLCDAAGSFTTNEGFEWSLINISAAAVDTITVAAGADHTLVGNAIVQSAHASTGLLYGYSAKFFTRKTAANTFVTYRVA
jgi:hypothetical protein